MSEQIPQCEQCQQRYTLFRRKKQCDLCGQIFCAKCISKPTFSLPLNKARACAICLLITNEQTSLEQLSSIRVKHLRAFLIHSKLATTNRLESCLEKKDLIDLIVLRKRRTTEDSYIFVERPNVTSNQTSNDNTATANVSNRQEAQATMPNSNEQVTSPSDTPPVPSNEPRTETTIHPPQQPPPPPPPSPPPPVQTKPVRTTLGDLSSFESINDLTIRQLKDILVQNFVSTKGCVEKNELIKKVELLYRDKQQQIQSDANGTNAQSDENLCKICMDASIDCVFLDCGHLCTCIQCGKRLSECPLCRSYIIRVVRVFKS